MAAFQKLHPIDSGLDILYYGNIAKGVGLSSSASIELATAVLMNELFNVKLDMIELVKLGQIVMILEKGDSLHFGELMKQSHLSLRNDYEITEI